MIKAVDPSPAGAGINQQACSLEGMEGIYKEREGSLAPASAHCFGCLLLSFLSHLGAFLLHDVSLPACPTLKNESTGN